jgi:hypothetical protein
MDQHHGDVYGKAAAETIAMEMDAIHHGFGLSASSLHAMVSSACLCSYLCSSRLGEYSGDAQFMSLIEVADINIYFDIQRMSPFHHQRNLYFASIFVQTECLIDVLICMQQCISTCARGIFFFA